MHRESFKRENHNEGVTEVFEFEGRGHALEFVKKYV